MYYIFLQGSELCNELVFSTTLFVAYYGMEPTVSPMHVFTKLQQFQNLSQAHTERKSLCNQVGIFTED